MLQCKEEEKIKNEILPTTIMLKNEPSEMNVLTVVATRSEHQAINVNNVQSRKIKNSTLQINKLKKFKSILDKKVKLSKYLIKKYQCHIENIRSYNEENQLIYGGIYLNLHLLSEEGDDPMRINDMQVEFSQYFNQQGVIILHFKERNPSCKDLNQIIRMMESMSSNVSYQIAHNLKEYQKYIYEDIQLKQQQSKFLSDHNLEHKYEQLYQQFQNWAIEQVKKLDGLNEFFSFVISKFSLTQLEFQNKIAGYSSALLALRGVDLENLGLRFSQNSFIFLSKQTCIGYIINLLRYTLYLPTMMSTPVLLTFDSLQIPFSCQTISIHNRDPEYPYFSDQFQYPSELQQFPDFQLNIRKYKFDFKDLLKVIKIREAQSPSNYLYSDLENYSKNLQFLKRFYHSKDKFSKTRPYKCGQSCCQGMKDDIIFQDEDDQI